MKKIIALLLCAVMSMSGLTALAHTDTTAEAVTSEAAQLQRTEMRDIRSEANEVSVQEVEASVATVTLSGTVSLPSGSKALEECYVCVEAVPVGERIVDTNAMNFLSEYTYIEKGKSSTSYSLDVPKGAYVLRAYSGGIAENTILGEYYFRNGKPVIDFSLAEKIDVTSNKTVNLELKKAESSISGTITFTEPLKSDVEVYLSTSTNKMDTYLYSEQDIYLEKGTKKLDYNIPVYAGITEVYLYGLDTGDLLFSGSDKLMTDWEDIRIFDTASKSYTNVNYICDNSTQDNLEGKIPVTLKLPKAEDDRVHYRIRFYDVYNIYVAGHDVNFNPGETEKTVYLDAPDKDFTVEISDEFRYCVGGEHGLTTIMQDAQLFDCEATTKIAIEMPECYELTGTVDRTGFYDGNGLNLDVFVAVDGETFSCYADAFGFENEAVFSIGIPKWYEGETANIGVSLRDAVNFYDTATVTVEEGMSADLSIPEGSTTVTSGTITLSEPAPTGGVGVVMQSREANIFYIPEGETSIDFSAELTGEVGMVNIRTYSDDINYNMNEMVHIDMESDVNEIELTVNDYVKISGSIRLPAGIRLDSGITFEVYLSSDMDYAWTNCYVDKDTRTGDYTVYIQKGSEVIDFSCYPYLETPGLPDEIRYVHNGDSDWESFTVNGDMTDVDFVIMSSAEKMLNAIKNGDLCVTCDRAVLGSGWVEADISYVNETSDYYEPVMVLASYDNGVLKDTVIYEDFWMGEESEESQTVYIDAEIDTSLDYRIFILTDMAVLAPLTASIQVIKEN